MSRPQWTIISSWQRSTRSRSPLRSRPPQLRRPALTNSSQNLRLARRNLAKDVIKDQPAARRQRNVRAGACEVTRIYQAVDSGPVDDRRQAEALGDNGGINPLAQP